MGASQVANRVSLAAWQGAVSDLVHSRPNCHDSFMPHCAGAANPLRSKAVRTISSVPVVAGYVVG